MTARWWCELAWLGGEDAEAGVLLEAGDDGVLTAVTSGVRRADAPDAEALGGLTLPGLVNAHSHAFHRALRGWTQAAGSGSFWTWRERMYALAARLDPDRYRTLAAAVFAEMALSGITTVGEFHYLHHGPGGRAYRHDAMGEAVLAAAADAGVRLTLLDACYLTGGIGTPLNDVQRRFADAGADGWASRLEGLISTVPAAARTVRVGAAIHSVRAVPPGSIATVVGWARHHRAPLHAHVSEQPAENDACLAAYGRTPTGLLGALEALGERFTAVHATHLTGDDVALLGASRSSVCMCPTTERDLADGIGPAAALWNAGSALCLGTDSHAVIDVWEEARAVELDQRLATGERGLHAPGRLLEAATAAGAAALGWPGVGRLAAGYAADMVTVRTDGVGLAGTFSGSGAGAAAAAVFAARGSDVTNVVVDGRTVVAGGSHALLGEVGPRLRYAIDSLWDTGP
ncbi:formimidoylglutamate deiminase [Acidiferrimicrobium sp. IK]|uniref:formimidoylglutamate deiminase n=1 Tax=Acidiferrimicrobium sp. IK TaxID=2871700 RepID=UPI0021CB27D5|nr:formimidoylglutamate deiminase [Acidiferrimicrobium sp. IK]MCU4183579.1 formimidoylglutamate deiminase [Acidiferrimicrobium sp. IK]